MLCHRKARRGGGRGGCLSSRTGIEFFSANRALSLCSRLLSQILVMYADHVI